MSDQPYHSGELFIQAQYGESDIAEANAPSSSSVAIPGGAMPFLSKQNLVVMTSHDKAGSPWVSVLFGVPGFMNALTPKRVEIDLDKIVNAPSDPLWSNLEQSPEAGLLAIEFTTRRRLKVNGPVERTEEKLIVGVEQAFALCPKYIQRRSGGNSSGEGSIASVQLEGTELNDELVNLIGRVDTMFVGSRHPDSQSSDASHRGGPKGFVQVLDAHTLRIPEYPGNGMFNTLGNFYLNPVAGLIFVDFEGRRTLQMTGVPNIRWDLKGPDSATRGTGRLWDFTIHELVLTQLPSDLSWAFIDESPFLPAQTLQEVQSEG